MTADTASLVSGNLEVWTGAVERKSSAGRGNGKRVNLYGIERLRALILDLAVRGKLVPQDASDERASALLPKIAAERAERIKAGGIRDVRLPQSVKEQPFALPAGWLWLPLGQTGNIFTGNSINDAVRAQLQANEIGWPFIATKDIGYGRDPVDYENGLLVDFEDERFNIARSDTVFICAEGGSAGKKSAISNREIAFGNKLIANEPWSVIEPRFVLYVYLSDYFFSCFSARMTGIIGGIARQRFLELPFPLPPFAEQQRIVAKVDELMALCDALEEESATAMAVHQTLVETLLATLTASADAADLAANWRRMEAHFDTLFTTETSVAALRSVVVDLALSGALTAKGAALFIKRPLSQLLTFGPKNGYSPRSVDIDTGIKSLSLTATTRGVFDGNHYKFVDIERPDRTSELWIKNGDILVQRANSIEYVGVSALYEGPDNQFIYPDLMMKLHFAANIEPKFAALCLNSSSVRGYLRSKASGTSGSMPKINQATLLGAEIPVPDKSEQQRIVAKVNELMSVCDTLKSHIADAAVTQIRLADAIVERAVA